MAQRLVKDSISPRQVKNSGEKNNEHLLEKTKTVQERSNGKNDNTITITDAESDKMNKGQDIIPYSASGASPKDKTQADIQQSQTYGGLYKTGEIEGKKTDEKYIDKTGENSIVTLPKVAENKIVPNEQVMTDSLGPLSGDNETKAISQNQLAEFRTEKAKEENQPKQELKKKANLKDEKEAPATAVSNTDNYNERFAYDQRYDDGVRKYSNADYSGSRDLLESYISENPGDYNALYYCGASYYFLGQYDKAIKYFEKVMKNKDGSFYETAQWYLALSYIAQKENKKAEKILNEILKLNGSFKDQAKERLLEIKK
jgi:tetratricopeptide (TPR) repeat protein